MRKVKSVHSHYDSSPSFLVHKVGKKVRGKEGQQLQRTRERNNHYWYNSPSWRKIRLAHISREPLCHCCKQQGRLMPAEITDHVIPHRGNSKLFWDVKNLQSLCFSCHNKKTALEKQGKAYDYRGSEVVIIDLIGIV